MNLMSKLREYFLNWKEPRYRDRRAHYVSDIMSCRRDLYWRAIGEKPTNPKDIIGSDKLPLGQVPASAIAYAALGHLEGTLKYGLVNWREVGVRWSIYYDACLRHMAKVHNGEWEDAATGVPHLGNALACINIIVDAYESGKLVDDRPKPAPVAGLIDRFTEKVKRLKGLFAHHQPQHYTQAYEVERAKEVAVPPAR